MNKKGGRLVENLINSTVISTVVVLVVMVMDYLRVMFSVTGYERRTSFFNTLFFETRLLENNEVDITMGLTGQFYAPIIAIFVLTIVCFIILNKSKNNE